MTSFFSDVVHAVRVLLKAPALTIVAALSLALGIGANTTIFSFVNAALLNPLPLEDSSSLVSVWTTDERNPGGYMSSSWPNYVDYRDKGQVFEGLAAQTGVSLNLVGGTGEPQRVQGELVSGNYFSVLHVTPLLGRVFLPEEDRTPGASFVAVLTYNLWQTRFGGDRSIVGQTVTLNNQPFTVIGVMPQGFRGTNLIGGPTLWVPYMSYPVTTSGLVREGIDKRRYLLFNITGRLKPGVNVAQAGANVRTIGRQLEQEYQNDNRGRGAALVPLGTLDPRARANIMTSVGLLITVVGLVLFIACANVASLLLSRAAARQKEIAIRLSLGASRLRLVRQLMTEGLVLAGLGGALGLLLAQWAQRVLWAYRPPFFQADAIDPSVNLRVLLFTIAVSLLTAILFGLVPALQASRPDWSAS